MQIDIFTLCDIAEIIQDKIVLSGTFRTSLHNAFPSTLDFSVVLSLSLDKDEIGKEHTIGIKCISPSSKELFSFNNKYENPQQYINFVLNIRQVHIENPGNYLVSFLFDGKNVRDYSFTANKA